MKNILKILVSKEDYWAIWLGAFFLTIGLIFFFDYGYVQQKRASLQSELSQAEKSAPFRTVDYYETREKLKGLKGGNNAVADFLKKLPVKPNKWEGNPLNSLMQKQEMPAALAELTESAAASRTTAIELTENARKASFADERLNEQAQQSIANWMSEQESLAAAKKKFNGDYNYIPALLMLGLLLAAIFGIGAFFMGVKFRTFAAGFGGIYIIALISYIIGEHSTMVYWGFGYAAWAIVIGLLISNTIGTPSWLLKAAMPEFYIKTGLVLLGSEILFSKILAIGLPGIFVAWVVTPIVLITTFWFGQKILKIQSKTLNITISADMSVCGVSAAIAVAAACRAKKEELTLAIGLSMIFTAVMMILLPALIKLLGLPEILGGAWIGGTIDSTGAVVAAGAFLGEKALNVAATIKMIQNILIGLVALGVAMYWSMKVDKEKGSKVGLAEIWLRFPKFILGFLGASILFSVIHSSIGNELGNALLDQGMARGFIKNLREWLFCLAFVSIGLSTNFRILKGYFKDGKALTLYICGQSFNLMLTLLMAWIMFYLVFPHITNSL
ncbi:MAG: putative sulfate exporter family transporter [Cyclobacteriaceae bacterium]|nr:putative sulfate exporter family transporter [Cyclobacteriaceae bacterium]